MSYIIPVSIAVAIFAGYVQIAVGLAKAVML